MTSLESKQTELVSTQNQVPVQDTEIFPHSEQSSKNSHNMETNQNIELQSNANMAETNTPIRTYSQAVVGSNKLRLNQHPDLTRLIKNWVELTRKALSELKTHQFDKKQWPRDRIINAFSSQTEFQEFIEHKLKTEPTQEDIPSGIKAKLFHQDRSFFRTFT
jgi:hypothetical protein